MDNILNLSYNSSNESQDFEESNHLPLSEGPENLISIDTSDEYDEFDNRYNGNQEHSHTNYDIYPSLHRKGDIFRTEEEFHAEINRLKIQSTTRFKNKWEEILHKYSQVDDEKESDEIDLASGNIIKDNGHLLSLRSGTNSKSNLKFDGDIWSVTYNLERDLHVKNIAEAGHKRKKKELKLQLKAQMLFHNVSLQSSPLKADKFIRKGSFALSSEDNLLSLNPSPPKKLKISPTKSIKSSSPVRYDDVSLLTPTKRRANRLSEVYNGSNFPTKLHFDEIPRLNMEGMTYKHEDNEDYEDLTSDPFNSYTNTLDRSDMPDEPAISHNSDDGASNTPTASDSDAGVETSDTSDVDSGDNKMKMRFLSRRSQLYNDRTHTGQCLSDNENDNEGDYSLDFDEQFLIVTDSYVDPPIRSSTNIYNCAVDSCHYCTGNKLLYQSHLLEKHSDVLKSLGYPVSSSTTTPNINISRRNINNLTEHFPLIYEVPPSPLSKNSEPFICGLKLEISKFCQKFFMTKEDLILHQNNIPTNCSSKKQVLICPMLGCGYMTDMGYLEWRSHFIMEKHHLHPKHRVFGNGNINCVLEEEKKKQAPGLSHSSHVPNLSQIEGYEESTVPERNKSSNILDKSQSDSTPSLQDVVKEINDIFSDSGSDLSINEYLSDEKDEDASNPELEQGLK